ncbi:LPXTG cell wall anchor domain-containing protein [Lactobacillus curvatus]|nr:LPXTG cell wall anchor domain-containing protein [Latilactobacillus curvatus]
MCWVKIKAKFVVPMLIIGIFSTLVYPTQHVDAAQTGTKSIARVGFYEIGETKAQNSNETKTKHQDKLPQTGTYFGWFIPIIGFMLLISSLSIIYQRRRNYNNEKIYN